MNCRISARVRPVTETASAAVDDKGGLKMNKTDTSQITTPADMSRRTFLQVSASGAVVATTLGGSLLTPKSAAAAKTFTWISPRGTLEVLDDYPYWIGKAMGYFGDLDTTMEAGPSDGTATVKFVAVGQADMGFPSPGVFSFALENDMDLVSAFNMGAVDVFDFAFRPGEGVTDLKELEGKTAKRILVAPVTYLKKY